MRRRKRSGREEGRGTHILSLIVTTGSLLGSIGLLKVFSILSLCLAYRGHPSFQYFNHVAGTPQAQKHSHEHSTQEPAVSQESQANDCIMAICGERLLCNTKGTFLRQHQEDFQTVTCRWHTPKDSGISHCPSGRCFPDPLYAILAC